MTSGLAFDLDAADWYQQQRAGLGRSVIDPVEVAERRRPKLRNQIGRTCGMEPVGVIVVTGYPGARPDGIAVIPIGTLAP